MTLDEFKDYCLNKPGVECTMPFGPNSIWFKVGSKGFAWTFIEPANVNGKTLEPFTFVNLKADPNLVEAQRQQYPGIEPGWHQNKQHWHSVYVKTLHNDQVFIELLDQAYDLVLASLSNRLRAEILDKGEST